MKVDKPMYCERCCTTEMVTRRKQDTAYNEHSNNWVTLCEHCHAENDDYWEERWNEYYSGCL